MSLEGKDEVDIDIHKDELGGDVLTSRDYRDRKMTEKGLQYTLQVKRQRLDQLSRGLEKNTVFLQELLDLESDGKEVKNIYKRWVKLLDEFLSVDEAHRQLLSPAEITKYDENWFMCRKERFLAFKRDMETWFATNVQHTDAIDADRISIATTSSRTSHRSSKSRSSVISARIAQEQKQAELEVKAESFKKKKEIEEAKLRLKLEEEELKIQEEIAISAAQCKVLDGIEQRSMIAHSTTCSDKSTMMAVVRQMNKPTSDLRKFGGDPLDYLRFKRQFKAKVLGNCDDVEEQLNYLDQFTTGEANKIVASYSYMDATEGYRAAQKELDERYGDQDVTVNAFVKRALEWPVIKQDHPKALDEFGVFLAECECAIKSVDAIKVLEYSDNFKKIVGKLPYAMHDRWRNQVLQTKEKGNRVTFSHLVKFVCREAKKINDPTFGKVAMGQTQKYPYDKVRSYATNVDDKGRTFVKKSCNSTPVMKSFNSTPLMKVDRPSTSIEHLPVKRNAFTNPCTFCEGPHTLESCTNLHRLPFYERTEFLKFKGYCFGCLRFGHHKSQCRNKATCIHCRGRHPSVLHVDGRIPPRSEIASGGNPVNITSSAHVEEPLTLDSHMGAGSDDVTMAIIPVKVRLRGSFRPIDTYAFLDPGSNVSFCSERLMSELGGQGKRVKLTLNTMGESHIMYTHAVKNVEISDLSQENTFTLPTLYTKDKMPVSHSHIPTSADIRQWPHLERVELPQISAEVGLLLGNNVADAYSPLELKVGPPGTPHASRTRLGWVAWNIIRSTGQKLNVSNRADAVAIERLEDNESLEKFYRKSVSLDFSERRADEILEHSVEDHKFLSKMSNSKIFENGHYQFRLPFREASNLPDNHTHALQRLHSIKKKLSTNTQFRTDYTKFMQNILDKGYAEEVPVDEVNSVDIRGKVWYLPHHGVYHAKKPGKIRVVFDCSSKYKGVSLNSMLLTGPDLTNNLVGVLMRFRQDQVAVVGDIECMFYQVLVAPEDRDYLRFYWWPGGNLNSEPIIYRMKVHLFGAASSPSCSNYALHQTVNDNQEYFEPQICEAVKRNFYVDDFLYSVRTEEQAIRLIHEISFLCSLGGFRLTKWLSNSRAVLESIDEPERANNVKDLSFKEFPPDSVLGVHWNVEMDTVGFQIKAHNYKPTRRNILSLISSVFDPLGLAGPFVLPAKVILQEACRKGLEWDQELSGNDLNMWYHWLNELPKLVHLSVPRCLKPAYFGDAVSVQLHHFSDASESGYGVTSYIRFMNDKGHIHCTLLFSRSRVAPVKKTTIPRMELTAATVAVRMSQMISRELDLDATQFFWTDSMSVIRYIANETTRFHTFVANRISLIRDCTRTDQWRYVESKVNHADIASRGSSVDSLIEAGQWIQGPQFLWKPESTWPEQPDGIKMLPENDPEVKQHVHIGTATTVTEIILPTHLLMQRCSYLTKLKRITAWILVAFKTLRSWAAQRKYFREQIQKVESDSTKVEVQVEHQMKQLKKYATCESNNRLKDISLPDEVLVKAQEVLIRDAQRQYYSAEIQSLSLQKSTSETKSGLKCRSSLYKLDPFLQKGILRVGGRLTRSSLHYDSKHQILIPHKSLLAKFILHDVHKRVGHLGKNSMIAELRKTFWITKVGTLIKGITSKCVLCRKYRAKTCTQKMADLPSDRVIHDKVPFSHTGMDYFGPFHVKRGRATIKRYGVLFTCFASRAVHLEVAYTLDTDSCIHAIRRFLARRGAVETLRSDNGTNLIGAERELRESIEKWNQSKIGRTLQQHSIKWEFNPPYASHFGGVWERLIRIIRKVLYSLLHEQVIHMDDEGLHTLFCEVESILNNRPITPVSANPDDLDALTPNDLLLLRTGNTFPCGIFDNNDSYSRRRWRQVQYLSGLFWKRWKDEYLHLLQVRQKWVKPTRNLSEGDIVLFVDQTRNAWTLARVLTITKDKKGLVRIVQLKTPTGILQRPIHKLALILEAENG